MKWFKHSTVADLQEDLQSLIMEYGYAGLGWYWHIMELAGRNMSKGDPTNCHARKTLAAWASELKCRPSTFRDFLSFCEANALLSPSYRRASSVLPDSFVKPSDLLITIEIPKLLILKDEYVSKSGDHSKVLPIGVGTVDIDRDEDKGLKDTSSFQAAVNGPDSKSEVVQVFDCWQSQPNLIHCRKLNGHEGAIKSAIEYCGAGNHGVELVCLCISRYSTLLRNDHGVYRQVYRWNLVEFLSRRSHYNLDRLSGDDWEKPFIQWEKSSNKQSPSSDLYVGASYD